MRALRFINARVGLTVTAAALSAAFVLSASCAGSTDTNGGSGGNAGGNAGGSSGGSSGGGSTSVSCTSDATTVCFHNGQAQGPMTGWGWVSLGLQDTLTDPTCDTDNHAITNANACTTTTNWNATDALCITGNIPALPATPLQSDYDNNWGVQIGVNTSEPPGITLGQSYASITITVTGQPSSGLRAELHIKGDPAGTTYCANMTSGKSIQLSTFNKQCWNVGTAQYDSSQDLAASSIQNIDKVGIQVSSTQNQISVSNLCLTSIAFK